MTFVLQERFCWFWHQVSYIRRTCDTMGPCLVGQCIHFPRWRPSSESSRRDKARLPVWRLSFGTVHQCHTGKITPDWWLWQVLCEISDTISGSRSIREGLRLEFTFAAAVWFASGPARQDTSRWETVSNSFAKSQTSQQGENICHDEALSWVNQSRRVDIWYGTLVYWCNSFSCVCTSWDCCTHRGITICKNLCLKGDKVYKRCKLRHLHAVTLRSCLSLDIPRTASRMDWDWDSDGLMFDPMLTPLARWLRCDDCNDCSQGVLLGSWSGKLLGDMDAQACRRVHLFGHWSRMSRNDGPVSSSRVDEAFWDSNDINWPIWASKRFRTWGTFYHIDSKTSLQMCRGSPSWRGPSTLEACEA